MGSLMGFLQKELPRNGSGTPEGYRLIKMTTAATPGQQLQLALQGMGVGTLRIRGPRSCQGARVDAVVIMYNVVQAESSHPVARLVHVHVRPNPVANSGQSTYYPGQQYRRVPAHGRHFIKTDKDGKALETTTQDSASSPRARHAHGATHQEKTG